MSGTYRPPHEHGESVSWYTEHRGTFLGRTWGPLVMMAAKRLLDEWVKVAEVECACLTASILRIRDIVGVAI